MNTEWLYCFVETAKQKSLSKAAARLNLTQPAASKQIRKLEETCGVTLFRRSAFGVELTEAGQLLLDRIRPLLQDWEDICRDLRTLGHPRHLRIGVLPSLGAYYLPRKLARLRERGIQADIVIRHTSKELLEMLRTGQIHAALAEDRPTGHEIWKIPLFTEPYFAVFPETHPLGRCSSVTMSRLGEEPVVSYPYGCDVRTAVVQSYEGHGLRPRIAAEVSFADSILGFVAAGAGIAFVPRIIAEHNRHLPLTAVPVSDFDRTRTVCLMADSSHTGKWLYEAMNICE